MSCKIVIITIDEPIYTTHYIEAIVKKFRHHIVAATVLSPLKEPNLTPYSSGQPLRVIKQRFDYYGLKSFLKFCFLYTVLKTADIFHKLGFVKRPFSVSSVLDKHRIRKLQCPQNDLNKPEYIERIKKFEPDLILCNFSQVVSKKFLDAAKIGCINTHYSLLPENRGREPLFWTLLNGGAAGVTIYKMTENVDAGAIIAQKAFSLDGAKTLHNAIKYSYEVSTALVVETLDKIIHDKTIFTEAIESARVSTCNKWPQQEHVTLFRKKGFEFI
ncbi:MAG: hypothetical protein JSW40_02835 [Candidatus Omnitrophota bacterium]|nr:MAG: hypothetical protein JSW40_02835 [Candidatus Omnitrophota bacterium]